jgi:hypothetical protein
LRQRCAAGANNWGTRGGRFPSRWRQLAGALPVGRLVAAASVRKEKGHSLWPLGAALLESARASPPCDARAPNGSHRGRGGGRMAAAAAWVPSEPVPLRPPSGAHQCHTWISLSATVPIRQPAARPPPDTHLTPGASLRSVYHKCFFPFAFTPPQRCVAYTSAAREGYLRWMGCGGGCVGDAPPVGMGRDVP